MVSFHFTPPDNHGKGLNPKSRRDRRRRQELFDGQSGKCHWCEKPMQMNQLRQTSMGRWKENPEFATFEHLLPRSHGGLNVMKNIVLAHAYCNGKRHIHCWPHDPVYGALAPPKDEGNAAMRAAFERAKTQPVYIGPAPGWRR